MQQIHGVVSHNNAERLQVISTLVLVLHRRDSPPLLKFLFVALVCSVIRINRHRK